MSGVCVNGVGAVCVRDALKWHVRWVRWVGVVKPAVKDELRESELSCELTK